MKYKVTEGFFVNTDPVKTFVAPGTLLVEQEDGKFLIAANLIVMPLPKETLNVVAEAILDEQKHKCQFCGAWTTQDDKYCYKNPNGISMHDKPKKDWEIVLCFDLDGNGGTHPFIPKDEPCGCEEEGCKIHSVRRISDGEIFTVGDSVQYKTQFPKPILAFDIYQHPDKGEILRVVTHCYNPPNDRQYNDIIEVEKWKQPLFTTEDGVDVYGGEILWRINTTALWQITEMQIADDAIKPPAFLKYFSTEAAAKEYVMMNKPCLSINDIGEWESQWKSSHSFRSFFDYLKESK